MKLIVTNGIMLTNVLYLFKAAFYQLMQLSFGFLNAATVLVAKASNTGVIVARPRTVIPVRMPGASTKITRRP